MASRQISAKRTRMKAPIDWLLKGEAWIEYRTRRDLLGESESDPKVRSARKAMLANAQVQQVIAGLSGWPGEVIASHKSASQPFHRLTFLADLGLAAGDAGVDTIVAAVEKHRSAEGPFQLPMNIAASHGGKGTDTWAWAMCDAPLILYALAKFGLQNKPAVKTAMAYLSAMARVNGWPCVVSKELGNFRGPGRKDDPCPFANLAMLKALSEMEGLRDGAACHAGAETLLGMWKGSKAQHPYMFYMGTDFRKLKVPFVWYDLMHVLEVLSQFEWLRKDARLRDMLRVLKSKADPQGRFTPESVWTAWKDWEFGQKQVPSRWLTLLAWRTIGRVEGAAI
jgi:hypothetical protein